jgi:hypothetical protein
MRSVVLVEWPGYGRCSLPIGRVNDSEGAAMLGYVDRIVSTARDAETALSRNVYEQQRPLEQRIPSFLRHGSLRNLLTTPII